jgi:hypothetical protein
MANEPLSSKTSNRALVGAGLAVAAGTAAFLHRAQAEPGSGNE